jgi:F0F1-type ATP synthase assembly protein I
MAEAKDILEKLKNLKSSSNSFEMKRRKGTISGAMIGVAGGLLIGYYRNYNLISSAIIGALVVGIATNLILPKNEE